MPHNIVTTMLWGIPSDHYVMGHTKWPLCHGAYQVTTMLWGIPSDNYVMGHTKWPLCYGAYQVTTMLWGMQVTTMLWGILSDHYVMEHTKWPLCYGAYQVTTMLWGIPSYQRMVCLISSQDLTQEWLALRRAGSTVWFCHCVNLLKIYYCHLTGKIRVLKKPLNRALALLPCRLGNLKLPSVLGP